MHNKLSNIFAVTDRYGQSPYDGSGFDGAKMSAKEEPFWDGGENIFDGLQSNQLYGDDKRKGGHFRDVSDDFFR